MNCPPIDRQVSELGMQHQYTPCHCLALSTDKSAWETASSGSAPCCLTAHTTVTKYHLRKVFRSCISLHGSRQKTEVLNSLAPISRTYPTFFNHPYHGLIHHSNGTLSAYTKPTVSVVLHPCQLPQSYAIPLG